MSFVKLMQSVYMRYNCDNLYGYPGRILGTSDIPLNYNFFSCENSHLSSSQDENIVEQLKKDVDAIFDGCTTFWVPARNFEPRTTLERLAKQIFDFHTKGLKDSPNVNWDQSGAEYWTQKRDTSCCDVANRGRDNIEVVTGENVLQNDDTVIRFHFDKDEDLVDQTDGDITVHPQISTVTYLTNGGSPTLVFPCCQANVMRFCGENVCVSGEYDTEIASQCKDQEVRSSARLSSELHAMKNAFAAYPKTGKHISFDGRYLHGSPSALSIGANMNGVRMTFLVNIWLNWKPLGPDIFAEEDIHLVSNLPVQFENLAEEEYENDAENTVTTEILMKSGIGDTYIARFGPNGWDTTLKFDWPRGKYIEEKFLESKRSSVAISYLPESNCFIAPTQRLRMSSIPTIQCGEGVNHQQIRSVFSQFRVVLLKNAALNSSFDINSCMQLLNEIHGRFPKEFEDCWHPNIEARTDLYDCFEAANFLKLSEGNTWKFNMGEELLYKNKRKRRKTDEKAVKSCEIGYKNFAAWEVNFAVNNSSPELYQTILKSFHPRICDPLLFDHSAVASIFNFAPLSHTEPADHLSMVIGKHDKLQESSALIPIRSQCIDDDETICMGSLLFPLAYSQTLCMQLDPNHHWNCSPPPVLGDAPLQEVIVSSNDVLLIDEDCWHTSIDPSSLNDEQYYLMFAHNFCSI